MLTEEYTATEHNGFVRSLNRQRRPHWSRVFVISDTHFGAPYSEEADAHNIIQQGLKYDAELSRLADYDLERQGDPAKICVLLGDIYDYIHHPKRKDRETMKIVIAGHMQHLFDMVRDHEHCQFIYVVGNHERHPDFDEAIDRLGERVERELGKGRLEITRSYKKIGDGLFIHGDQAISPKDYFINEQAPNDYSGKDGRYEESHRDINRDGLEHTAHIQLTKIMPRFMAKTTRTPARCATKILKWCHGYDKRHPDETSILDGVSHIFTGHTHDPYMGFDFKDPFRDKHKAYSGWYHFHNTGAPIGTLFEPRCFNALNVYLDTSDVRKPDARIAKVSSFKWPERSWSKPEAEYQGATR